MHSIRYTWRSMVWSIRRFLSRGWYYDRSGLILLGAGIGVLVVVLILFLPQIVTERLCILTGCD